MTTYRSIAEPPPQQQSGRVLVPSHYGAQDRPGVRLAEAVAAAARAGGVGIVDSEPTTLQGVLVIEGRTTQQRCARRVDDNLDVTEHGRHVVVGDVGVEEHLVAEARAAAGSDGD